MNMITYITALITWQVGYLDQRFGEAANPGPGASSPAAIENEDDDPTARSSNVDERILSIPRPPQSDKKMIGIMCPYCS